MKRLFNKTALITGAGRGLGAAIARRFSEEGCKVVVTDINEENAQAIAREVDGVAMALDVADSSRAAEVFKNVGGTYGGLDILVNNAGINGVEQDSEAQIRERVDRMLKQAEEAAAGGPIVTHNDSTMEMSDADWQRMLSVHMNGTFYCTREALKLMKDQGSGVIINLGSIMGTAGGAGSSHYCAAKAGILGFTRSLAREVVTRGIRVNAIAPGWIDTDMTSVLAEARALIALQTPMGRFGDVDDIAWAAVYLASDEAKFVTGQVLSPNGGWHMSQ